MQWWNLLLYHNHLSLFLSLSLSLCLHSTGNECDPNDLSDPENGMVTFDSVSLGSVATYTCDQAFSLMGQSTRTCVRIGANTVWSGQAPTCECKNAHKKKKTNKARLVHPVISPSTYLHDLMYLA